VLFVIPSILLTDDIFSESRLVIVQKFLSYIEDMKSGKIEGSVLSPSLDYVTAEDGGSDLVWKSLRTDLEMAGISTSLIDKHRALITTKFTEILKSGVFSWLEDEGQEHSQAQAPTNDQQSESNEDDQIPPPEAELDLHNAEVFFTLASRGHAKGISAMLQAGMSANFENENGETALHLAASTGSLDVVNLLLDHGALTNTQDGDGRTPLRHALENGHHSVLRAMVSHSASADMLDAKVDRMGHVILHYAVNYGDGDSVFLLLKSGANPNIQNLVGQTPLHFAAWRRDLIVLKHLVDVDVDMDIEDFWGDTALEVAIASPVTTADKSAVIRVFLDARIARGLESVGLDIDQDDAVEFLTMDSIYDIKSEDNIFKALLEGGNIAELLTKQFEMNDLGEELFEAIYGPYTN
jgi:ankyrin repeat protein